MKACQPHRHRTQATFSNAYGIWCGAAVHLQPTSRENRPPRAKESTKHISPRKELPNERKTCFLEGCPTVKDNGRLLSYFYVPTLSLVLLPYSADNGAGSSSWTSTRQGVSLGTYLGIYLPKVEGRYSLLVYLSTYLPLT